jgi:hypothetical protein
MEFWAVAREVGLPVAFLMIALVTGRVGVWAWGRELVEAEKRVEACENRWKARYEEAQTEWRDRLREVEADFEERIAKQEASSARWEALALEAHGIARTAAHALEKTVK